MTYADVIEHVLPVVARAVTTDHPARAFSGWFTWWMWHASRARVEA